MEAETEGSNTGDLEPEKLAEIVLGRGRPLGFLLDFDGTLSEIVPRPGDAEMRPGTRSALEGLLAFGADVAIVSGRALDDVAVRANLRGAWIAGSHGAELLDPSGVRVKLVNDRVARRALEDVLDRAVAIAAPLGLLVEDKGLSVAVHLRGLEEHAKAELVEKLGAVARADPSAPVVVLRGLEVLEVRACGVDKGRAARVLLEAWRPVHAVAIGDDVTDEDMLREAAARGGDSIKVGHGPTAARFRLSDPAAVERLLRALCTFTT